MEIKTRNAALKIKFYRSKIQAVKKRIRRTTKMLVAVSEFFFIVVKVYN